MRNNIRIWLGVAGVLCIICIIVVLGVWYPSCVSDYFRPVEKVSLHRIEELTGVAFPPATKLLDSCFVGGQGWELRAKLVMDKSSIQGFVDSLPSPRKTSQITRLGISNSISDYSRVAWWNPDSAASFTAISAKYLPEGNVDKEIRILIVDDNLRQSVVYIFSAASW